MFVCRLNKKVTIWSHLPSPFFPHSKKIFFYCPEGRELQKTAKEKTQQLPEIYRGLLSLFCKHLCDNMQLCGRRPSRLMGWSRSCQTLLSWWGQRVPLQKTGRGLCEAVQLWRNPNAAQIITQHLTILPLSPIGVLTAPTADESPPRGQAHVGKGGRRPFAQSLGAWLAWPFGFPVVDSSLLPCRLGGRLSQVWMDGRECAGPPGGGP